MAEMEFKTLADGNPLPALGLGTWGMGGWQSRSEANDAAEITAIKAAVSAGLTHIDTAEMYGSGHAEELVCEALKDISLSRRELFITSKKWADNLGYEAILASAKASLRRLSTKYLDLYLLHFYNPAYPLKKTMQAMDHLVDEGLTRYIGVSNFSLAQLKRAQAHAEHPLVANQVQYNLLDREYGENLLDYCRANDILLVAWEPLKKGALTRPGHRPLDRLAQKYNKTHAQVALRWLLDQPGVVTIPKMADPAHLQESLGGLGWHLSEADWEALGAR